MILRLYTVLTLTVLVFLGNPANAQLDSMRTQEYYLLCKSWGHLKYFHTEVAKGNLSWDNALEEAITIIDTSVSGNGFPIAIDHLFSLAGRMEKATTSPVLVPDSNRISGDVDWTDSPLFSNAQQLFLDTVISEYRPDTNAYVYPFNQYVRVPQFDKDNAYYNRTNQITKELRLLALFRFWNAIEYFSPFKKYMSGTWDENLLSAIPEFYYANTEHTYLLALLRLATKTNDSHTYLSSRYRTEWYGANYTPFHAKFIENELVVTSTLPTKTNLKIGDVIVKIDGLTIQEYRDSLTQYTPHSNPSVLNRSLADNILYGEAGNFDVEVRKASGFAKHQEERFHNFRYFLDSATTPTLNIDTSELGCTQAIIDMGQLEFADIDSIFNSINDIDVIIFDCRNYPNGTLWGIVNHLYPDSIQTAFMKESDVFHPGTLFGWKEFIGQGTPTPYRGNIAILMNEQTQSQAEYTVMGLEQFPDALKIGSQTAGSDGSTTKLFLPGQVTIRFGAVEIFYPDHRQTQQIGIVPDIKVKPTIQGVIDGRDEVLETAKIQFNCGYKLGNDEFETQIERAVFPNPFSDILTIEPEDDNIENILIRSASGQIVFQVSVSESGVLKLGHLATGVYTLQYTKGTVINRVKLVKSE